MYGQQQDLMSGFRPTLQQYAMQNQPGVLDLPGKLPASSVYIDPGVMTQPTGTYNPMPESSLPLHELGLGIKSASGEGGQSPIQAPLMPASKSTKGPTQQTEAPIPAMTLSASVRPLVSLCG